jgi:hypothetical protein
MIVGSQILQRPSCRLYAYFIGGDITAVAIIVVAGAHDSLNSLHVSMVLNLLAIYNHAIDQTGWWRIPSRN